jgi:nucleoside-diphosphate-sugar epimerase
LNAISLRGIVERVSKLIEIEPVIEEVTPPPQMPLRYVSDTTRITNDLGWRPQIGIDSGLAVIL